MPTASNLISNSISGGGWIKTTKSWFKRAPCLAKLSAHLLASLKQCINLTLEIFFRPSLQTATSASKLLNLLVSFLTKSITTLASNSISTAGSLRAMQSRMPSRKAHSSAATLVVMPMARAYPFTHSPFSFRISPPLPAKPGLPFDEPFEFNLNQLLGGFSYLT